MVDTTLLLHANLLYAEIPFSEIPNIVDKSYLPVLEMLEKNPAYKVTLNWTGFTLDVLSGSFPKHGKYPEVIDLLKTLIKRGQVEITGTSWAHGIYPLCPLDVAERDLEQYLKTVKRILGIRPKGFFPPELSIDPLLPHLLKKHGFEWSFVDHDALRYTRTGLLNVANDFKPVPPSFTKELAKAAFINPLRQLIFLNKMKKIMRGITDMSPIIWNGAGDADITAIRSYQPWNSYSITCLGRIAIMNEKKLYSLLDQVSPKLTGFFLPFSSDFEFYGFGGNVSKEPIPISRLKNLLEYIHQSKHLNFELPSKHLEKVSASKFESLYLRSSSWSTDGDFALWDADPDNRRLNDFVRDVWERYRKVKNSLSEKEREKVEKSLLLSINSDGRGWTPIPEHRLFCYNEALSAMKTMEKY